MRRTILSVAAIGAAALLSASTAAAHVEVTPTRVARLSSQVFVFSTPNERERAAVIGLRVQVPPGIVLGEVEARPGWTATATPTTVSWQGSRIPPGQFETFSLLATATGSHTVMPFRVIELFSDGTVERYRPTVKLAGAAAAADALPRRDRGARTLGKVALGISLAAAAGVLLLGFGCLALWLTAPWQTRDPDPAHQLEQSEPEHLVRGLTEEIRHARAG